MKKIALAAAFSLAATSAFAGGVAEPVTDAAVIAEQSTSAGGFIVPLLLLIIVALAASKSSTPTPVG